MTSLLVYNLQPEVTEKELFLHFGDYNLIVDSVRVCRNPNNRLSLGHAYVNFASAADAELSLNHLHKKWKGTILRRKTRELSYIVRVNRFPFEVRSTLELCAIFKRYGKINYCHLPLSERDNYAPKGFAFVGFKFAENAKTAIRCEPLFHPSPENFSF
jgi:polyadenylate-binding protein